MIKNNGRRERIRTSGPCLPKAVLYQAELLSEPLGSVVYSVCAWLMQRGLNKGHWGDFLPCAAVIVGEANDIVFAQVIAGLNLDEVQINDAGVSQAVAGALGDIDGFIRENHFFQVVAFDLGSTGNDHPMLGTVVVHLQRQRAAGIDNDLLDLKQRPTGDGFVGAPGALRPHMLGGQMGL